MFTHAEGSRGGKVAIAFCLSICCDISKTDAETDHQTWCTNVPRWVLEIHLYPFILDQKVEGQGHKSKQTVPTWVIALLWVLASFS